jgi:integrase
MPRKGYRSITLNEKDYLLLIERANLYGTSSQKLIEMLMEDLGDHVVFNGTFPSSGAAFATSSETFSCPSMVTSKSFIKNADPKVNLRGCTVLEEFAKFCSVDLGLAPRTVDSHIDRMANVFNAVGPVPSLEQLRSFLSTVDNPSSFNNHLKALRAYYRDFKGDDSLIKTFRWRRCEFPPHRLFSREELSRFSLELTESDLSLFLMFASTGRRFSEIISLQWPEIDLKTRTLQPNHFARTKRSYYSFFNQEAKDALEGFEPSRGEHPRQKEGRIFTASPIHVPWRYARIRTGLPVTPQSLRFWFANEMARFGVPDRFIDAFQGRIPRSILARHYTDFSLDNLRRIYDGANLKVLATNGSSS